MSKRFGATLLLAALAVSLACGPLSSTVTPAPPAATETATAAPSTPTPVPSPTPPRSTPTPAFTETPVLAGLNSAGPHVVFAGPGGVWLTNPDGSFPVRLTDSQAQTDLRSAISPKGDRLALVAASDTGYDLNVISIPSGQSQTVARLINITRAEEVANPASDKAFATYAIRDINSLAWQPGGGRLLAFIGAMQGPTADLYTYDSDSGKIARLTDGLSQAILPIWSPDGQYLLSYGVSSKPPFGGAILPYNHLDGAWAVRVSDGKVIPMPVPKGAQPNFVAWQDAGHYLTFDYDETCGARGLRSVDVTSGKTASVLKNSFYTYIAQSPENGALLFASQQDQANCPDSLPTGTYLLTPGASAPVRILDKHAWEIDWLPESGLFFAYPEALVSADGQTRYDPPVYDSSFHPAVSENGDQAWLVIENQTGRVMLKSPGSDWRKIMDGLVQVLLWGPAGGKTLLMVMDDGALVSASAPDFAPRRMGSMPGARQAMWLP